MIDILRTVYLDSGIASILLWGLLALGVIGSFNAAFNPDLSLSRKIAWIAGNIFLPGTVLIYFTSGRHAGAQKYNSWARANPFLEQHLSAALLYRLKSLPLLIIFPMIFLFFTLFAEYNSRDMLRDQINSYWCRDFKEMNAQLKLSFQLNEINMPGEQSIEKYQALLKEYNKLIGQNPDNAFAYYRRSQLKELYLQQSGATDLLIAKKIVLKSIKSEEDPKRLAMLQEFQSKIDTKIGN